MESNPVNNLQIEPGKKFFTHQARRAHVRAYLASSASGESKEQCQAMPFAFLSN